MNITRAIFFVIITFVSRTLLGQVTITYSDMPSVNYIMIESLVLDTSLIKIDPALTGANYTWNYCNLYTDSQLVDTFVSVSSTLFAYQLYFNNAFIYPNYDASYARRGREIEFSQGGMGVSITDVYDYFKNDNSDYKQVGFGANINGIPASVQYDGIDYIYRFPMDYGNTDASDAAFVVQVPNLGTYGQIIHRENEVDGWGQITTPYDTYDAVRVRTLLEITDTVYLDQFMFGTKIPRPAEYIYNWFANGESIPVFTIRTRETGGSEAVTSVSFKDQLGGSAPCVSGLENLVEDNELLIFPNPVKDQFSFTQSVSDVVIYNSQGKVVYNKTGVTKEISTMNFEAGVYFIQTNEGSAKFVVSK